MLIGKHALKIRKLQAPRHFQKIVRIKLVELNHHEMRRIYHVTLPCLLCSRMRIREFMNKEYTIREICLGVHFPKPLGGDLLGLGVEIWQVGLSNAAETLGVEIRISGRDVIVALPRS